MTSPAIPSYGERQALPIDAMTKRMNDMLAGIDLTSMLQGTAAAPGPLDDNQKLAGTLAARLFGSDDGRWLLEFLADNIVRRPQALPPLGFDPVQAYCQVQRRAGQDDVFFYLLRLIAIGREEQPQQREGSTL